MTLLWFIGSKPDLGKQPRILGPEEIAHRQNGDSDKHGAKHFSLPRAEDGPR